MASRKYRRDNKGRFGSGSTTVKQDRPGHQAVKKAQKDKLNLKASGGTKRKKKIKTGAKVKGKVLRTKQSKNAANRTRKRFG